MGVDNFVGLRFHIKLYTGVISQFYQQWVSNGSVGLFIPRTERLRTIWDEVFFKLEVYFDVLVSRKKVFLESGHHIETYIYVVVEVIEVQSSSNFDFHLDE